MQFSEPTNRAEVSPRRWNKATWLNNSRHAFTFCMKNVFLQIPCSKAFRFHAASRGCVQRYNYPSKVFSANIVQPHLRQGTMSVGRSYGVQSKSKFLQLLSPKTDRHHRKWIKQLESDNVCAWTALLTAFRHILLAYVAFTQQKYGSSWN
jgi:hypothetical protein